MAQLDAKLEGQLRQIIDAVGDGLVLVSNDGRIIGSNPSACRMLDYSADELIRMTRAELVAPDDARIVEARERRKQTGSFHGEVTLLRRGGEPIEVELTSVAFTDAAGQSGSAVILHDLSDRRRAESAAAALAQTNQLLTALTDAAFEAVLVHRGGVILSANRAAHAFAGVATGALVGQKLTDFIAPQSLPIVAEKIAARDERPYAAFARRADGSIYPVEVQVRNLPVPINGGMARVVVLRDVSARQELEEQFRQAQKMEAIGRLAGGIAHDFNNLLSVIIGASTLAAHSLPAGHPAHQELKDVETAAERAAGLTRQLLAFSRKQVLQPRVIDVNAVLTQLESMLRRVIGEDISLELHTRAAPGRIKADPGQLENVVMNLVVNARDAMPDGGRLVIETANAVLDDASVADALEARAGAQVMISVRDTGTGMDAATRARIFEPFFTTKEQGRGTGLGLSTVYGVVRQCGGTIGVVSQPGEGSTFRLHFPASAEPVAVEAAPQPGARGAPASQVLMVVEDEPELRRVVSVVLRQAGYRVLEAPGPAEALALAASHREKIDLLVTDVVMPGMNGKQLADALTAARPGLKVLFISGYSGDSIGHRGVLDASVNFLPKPVTPAVLLAAVLGVLAQR